MQIERFNNHSVMAFKKIEENHENDEKLKQVINENIANFYIFITDEKGNVLLQPNNQNIVQIDIEAIRLREEAALSMDKALYKEKEIIYSKLRQIGSKRYVVLSKLLIKDDTGSFMFIGGGVFILLFFLLTFERMHYIKKLSGALKTIATGDLDTFVAVKGKDELSLLADNINDMVREIKNRKEKQEQAEKTKNELIVNMSHDLRTPLTSIIGYIKLLKQKNTVEELDDYITIVDDKAQRLEKMIDDLFEYTLLLNDQMQLSLTKVSINELIRQVVEEMMPLAQQNDGVITYSVLEDDQLINVDVSRMVRVYENIIANAIKYGQKPGHIEVKLKNSEECVLISIFNKGESIDKDEVDKLFERLYRTDKARCSHTSGSGIGLSIAKSIVESHNGRIWAEGTEDGITFYIEILI